MSPLQALRTYHILPTLILCMLYDGSLHRKFLSIWHMQHNFIFHEGLSRMALMILPHNYTDIKYVHSYDVYVNCLFQTHTHTHTERIQKARRRRAHTFSIRQEGLDILELGSPRWRYIYIYTNLCRGPCCMDTCSGLGSFRGEDYCYVIWFVATWIPSNPKFFGHLQSYMPGKKKTPGQRVGGGGGVDGG